MSDTLTVQRICNGAAGYFVALRIVDGVVSYFHHDCTWGDKRDTLSHKWAFTDELLDAIAKTGLHWVLRHSIKDTWEYDITAPQELSSITITQFGEDDDKREGYPYWQATRSVAVGIGPYPYTGTRNVLHYFNHPPDNNNAFGLPQDPIQHAWASRVELEQALYAYLAMRGQSASEVSPGGMVGDVRWRRIGYVPVSGDVEAYTYDVAMALTLDPENWQLFKRSRCVLAFCGVDMYCIKNDGKVPAAQRYVPYRPELVISVNPPTVRVFKRLPD